MCIIGDEKAVEKISRDEANRIIRDLIKNYEEDGYSYNDAKILAESELKEDFEW